MAERRVGAGRATKKKTATKKSARRSDHRIKNREESGKPKRKNAGHFSGKDDPRNGGGRPKGSLNKTTREVKRVIMETFENLGGVPAFTAWAEQNQKIFYAKIYPRLIPHEITGEDGGPIKFEEIRRVLVRPDDYDAEQRRGKE